MAARDASTPLATALVAGLALVVGLVLGPRVLGEDGGRARDAVADGTSEASELASGELVNELRALREQLEARAAEALATPGALEPRRVVDTGATQDADALVAALDARLASLEAAIARLADAQAPGVAPVSSLQFPEDDFEPLPWPVRDEISTTEFSQRHLYWTSQQVVDAYGLPAEVSATRHDQHVWSYVDGDGEDLEFVFHQGVLLRVEW